jgi:hypothetical protein
VLRVSQIDGKAGTVEIAPQLTLIVIPAVATRSLLSTWIGPPGLFHRALISRHCFFVPQLSWKSSFSDGVALEVDNKTAQYV